MFIFYYYWFYRGLLTEANLLFEGTHITIIETELHYIDIRNRYRFTCPYVFFDIDTIYISWVDHKIDLYVSGIKLLFLFVVLSKLVVVYGLFIYASLLHIPVKCLIMSGNQSHDLLKINFLACMNHLTFGIIIQNLRFICSFNTIFYLVLAIIFYSLKLFILSIIFISIISSSY